MKTISKNPLYIGLLIGIVLSIWDGLNYFVLYKTPFASYSPFVGLILLVLGIFLGMRLIKRDKFDGAITFSQATFSGILISIAAGLVLAITTFFYYRYLNCDFQNFYLDAAEKAMIEKKLKPEEINTTLQQIKLSLQPENQLQAAIFGTLLMGLVASSIFSFFLRNKENKIVE
ncbi:MAG TPA: DUF4199 domain-containing protein [Cytophagaceae bacterium]|jgi:predicted permease